MPNDPYGGQWIQGRPGTAELSSPGRIVTLKNKGDNDTIDARCDDPLINEWCIIVQPGWNTVQDLATGIPWDITMTIQLWHDSAKFVYYRSIFNNTPKPVSVVGTAVGVHGQRVRVGLYKGIMDAPVALTINCAIIPRCPCKSVLLEGPLNFDPFTPSRNIPIPSMARAVRVIGPLSPGDFIRFLDPAGAPGLGDIVMSDPLLGIPLPLSPDAGYVRYTSATAVPKLMWFEFETWF